MKFNIPDTYEILEERPIADLKSDSYILRHRKTGARLALLSNEDDNKVFYIGFRTPPTDSTGVAHIIEHTVLCGSEDFPVKDPFIELAKGSLNTFLNAMTYPDKTVYPVASCNDKDFQNLMHVYLDAVFHPNIYKTEKIFEQEGWHYEMESEDSELTINGVVYNEMKGAFSSPDDVLARNTLNSLYPDTTYAIESGGDPEVIPDLTYEQYLDFHRRYYHPSNSYIYLYGDMDMTEKLNYLDAQYLSRYDALEVDSHVGLQKPFDKPQEIRKTYSVLEGEELDNHTYLSMNWSVGDNLDPKLYVALDVLDYCLCGAPGAVLKKALIEKGIGSEIYGEYENDIHQPYYSVVAKNANEDQKDEFIRTVREVLQKQAEEGLDKKSLLAGINSGEFKYREADFGRFPKGLLYGLQALDSWLYDDRKPWIHIEANETYRQLRESVDTGYFEELIRTCFLNNQHQTILVLAPEAGLAQKKDQELKDKLTAYRESLSQEEIRAIVRETADLKAYQEEEDSQENLEKIPLLSREDLRREIEPYHNEERSIGDTKILYHNVFTNGISYITFLFDLSKIPGSYFPYIGLLKTVLSMVDTDDYTYEDLNNEIGILTGGMSGAVNVYPDTRVENAYSVKFETCVKVLHDHLEDAFRLMNQVLLHSHLDDVSRIREVLEEAKSQFQADMISAGHQVAAARALSHISESSAVTDAVNGLAQYRLLCSVLDGGDAAIRDLSEKLQTLCHMIFRQDNLLMDVTCEEKDYEGFQAQVNCFAAQLFTDEVETGSFHPEVKKVSEAFQTAGQVQFVCRAGNFRHHGIPYTGALNVLRVIMGYDYLWGNIRVKGGAYGCMSSYMRSGNSYFVTYRDPHLKRSLDVFEGATAYLENFDADEREMTQFVIGAVSSVDTPKTPRAKGQYGLSVYLSRMDTEMLQKNRNELLDADASAIRALARQVSAFLSDGSLCVVGTADKIREYGDLFDTVEPLL